ncbi:unnamed protein product (macronuclear) [Paramecium tetraurelia]|uniref:Uncharacterized protein n=1 Tax=Paramecium tetraurelia TaxID=5888 RepID=A0E0B1_PARTE|nr:uncharacterized protein GSPATT00021896001 [Paramecium tetraurelia]CAK88728.1 unnamed protein product [Paramecium tetraurelia]|eukprot:XP_001456125.1 hypothetical protein (macronuclear) [Paramecium tetraurelia strain d4-2]
MNEINEEKINCQLYNLSNQNVLNSLEYIAFNSNSTILLAIQQNIINSYYFKNNYLKHISSIKVLRKGKDHLEQLEYLKGSNSILTTIRNNILIANLSCLKSRKILQKIGHRLYSGCQQMLFNQNQNNLFISSDNQVLFIEKNIEGWKQTQKIQLGYRDYVISMCLNLQEDELQIYADDGYNCSAYIYIYQKQTQQQEINWILIQNMRFGNGIGKLWGGFVNQLLFFNEFSLDVYKKSNQSQDYIEYVSSQIQSRSLIFCQFLQNKLVLLIEKNNTIRVMKLNLQQKLEFVKSIEIDMSALINKFSYYSSIKATLTQDENFLIIWNQEKTLIIKMIYI